MKILLVSLETHLLAHKSLCWSVRLGLCCFWDPPGPAYPVLHLLTEKKAAALNPDPNTAQADTTSIQSLVATVTSLTPHPACEET